MDCQANKQITHKAAMLAVPALAAVIGLAVFGPAISAQAAEVTSSSSEATVSVTIDKIEVTILEINGDKFSNDKEASETAIRTLNNENTVKFTADRDAHIKIVSDGKTLWEGDVKAGQVNEVKFSLAESKVGIHAIEIQSSIPGVSGYSVAHFSVDYRPVIPSIIPSIGPSDNGKTNANAPNTGLYFNLGGQMYSATTIAIVLLLAAVIVYLLVRHNAQHADDHKAPASTKKIKAARKKMDLI